MDDLNRLGTHGGKVRVEGSAGHYRSISRAEAHKTTPDSVWLGPVVDETPRRLVALYDIPTTPAARFVDLMEVQRQVGMAQIHRALAIDQSAVFVLNEISLSVERPRGVTHSGGTRGTARVEILTSTFRNLLLRAVTQEFFLTGEDGMTAKGRSRATFIAEPLHARLRRGAIAPGELVKIGSDGGELLHHSPLIVDWSDPVLADHRSDHVPAMAVVRAIEVLATRSRPEVVVKALDLTFDRYLELDPRSSVVISYSGLEIDGGIFQHGGPKATFRGEIDILKEAL